MLVSYSARFVLSLCLITAIHSTTDFLCSPHRNDGIRRGRRHGTIPGLGTPELDVAPVRAPRFMGAPCPLGLREEVHCYFTFLF